MFISDMYFWAKKKKKITEKKVKTEDEKLVNKLDRVFSAYIRLRDVMCNGYFVCISCGKIKHFSEGDCGHFYSRRHMSTRFDEDNCHMECRSCNSFDGDHLHGYTANLERKIGKTRLDILRWKHNQYKKWTKEELQMMIDHYRLLAKQLRTLKGVNIKI